MNVYIVVHYFISPTQYNKRIKGVYRDKKRAEERVEECNNRCVQTEGIINKASIEEYELE